MRRNLRDAELAIFGVLNLFIVHRMFFMSFPEKEKEPVQYVSPQSSNGY
jgi:hypothetical protein